MNKVHDNKMKITYLNALAVNFNSKIEQSVLMMWVELLDEYSSELVKRACLNVIKNYEYKTLPPFAVIQKEIDKLTGNSAEAKKNIPFECWLEIEKALETNPNKDNIPKLSPRAEHALKRIGGWYNLCLTDNESLKWKKKEFLQIADNSLSIPVEHLAIDSSVNTSALEEIKRLVSNE